MIPAVAGNGTWGHPADGACRAALLRAMEEER